MIDGGNVGVGTRAAARLRIPRYRHLCCSPFLPQGFFELTGYLPDEILGVNCRFLQVRAPATASGFKRPMPQGVCFRC
jgi:hypothetical protein